jgi:hypothetical protein
LSWVAASVYLSDGRVLRVGGDEADPADQPSGISWDTSNPGGFGSGSITLPRPENLYADDAKLFSHVEIYGELGTYFEGYVSGVPQVGTDEIQLSLSGWSSVLDKHETFREIFVDRDMSRWGDAARSRRLSVLNGGTYGSITGPSVESDTEDALPALTLTLEQYKVAPAADAWYDAGTELVGSIYYDMTSLSSAAYSGYIAAADADDATGITLSSELLTGTDSSASGTFTPTTPQRYGAILLSIVGTVGSVDRSMTIRNLAVFGDHGLTKRGTAPNQGYYTSDVVNYAIAQAPSLTASLGESIESTSFVIPHLTFTDDTSLRSVVEQMTALGGNQNVANDWGVYEDREFYWRSPGTYGRTWHVRRDQVATSSSDGPDADRRVAGVKVNYTDGSGTSLSVGPPGSNADYETTDLLDTDTDNPAYRIPGAFKSESVGITSRQGAINIGAMILNERNRLDWRGSVEVQGEAEDENGNTFPAALIRSGDRIVISDSDDTTPRTIVSTQYDHGSMTCSASIGAHPDSLEALLGQLALVTDLVAT